MHIGILLACLSMYNVSTEVKKRDQITLELEFLMLLDHYVCVVNQILVLYKNSKCP